MLNDEWETAALFHAGTWDCFRDAPRRAVAGFGLRLSRRPRPARQRHERKVNSIVVVTQIEHAWKASSREFRFIPGAVGILPRDQELDPTRGRRIVVPPGGRQAQ